MKLSTTLVLTTAFSMGLADYASRHIHDTAADHIPDDYKNLVVADTLESYLNHLAKTPVRAGSEVHETLPLQLALQEAGETLGPCGADGIYGPAVVQAVRRFQEIHKLTVTGDADTTTLKTLYTLMLENASYRVRLTEKLITPFQTPEARQFVADLPRIFSRDHIKPIQGNATLMITGFFAYANAGDEGKHMAAAYRGCVATHRRDAFRHSSFAYRLARSTDAETAVALLDGREFYNENPLPSMLMDIFNHRIAAGMGATAARSGDADKPAAEIVSQALTQGRFMLYPFPLIPR